MIDARLKRLVKEEAENLKRYADSSELRRISFDTFDPTTKTNCIYGQMTGNCYSPRASELLGKCAMPFGRRPLPGNAVARMPRGNETAISFFHFEDGGREVFSAIETYVLEKHAKPAPLLAYLTSEIPTLDI